MCESLADVGVQVVGIDLPNLADCIALKHHLCTILRLHEEVFKGLKCVIVHV